ncbi:MAG: hypothetical protein HYS05_02735 [Acidobacteria bacterium]|nr:hypothetical protein [Acidobacteriota bacterium]
MSPTRARSEATEVLFQGPLEDFTRARNELAARVKAGDAAKASEIKALAKPSVSAWAVNQLFWTARREYDVLMKAGKRLRDVQQAVLEGRRGDLRQASEARQEALVAALDRAMKLAGDAGHPASPALHQRVARTLEALAAYGGAPPVGTPGQLSQDLDPPGFGALAGLTSLDTLPTLHDAPAPKPDLGTKPTRTVAPHSPARVLPHDRDLARARAELAEAEREARRLRSQADRAEAARRQAVERDAAARQDVDEAHRTLERAKERAMKAADDLHAAQRDAVAAEKAAAEAEEVVTTARAHRFD